MLRHTKAQSAVEFLVTYGWAFIMVLGFVGALFYLDILNFTSFLPDECEFSSEIDCQEMIVIDSTSAGAEDGSIFLMLSNNLGTSVNIDECHIRMPGIEGDNQFFCADARGSCGTGDYNLSGNTWEQGETLFFNFSQCDTRSVGLSQGVKRDVYMTLQYHAEQSSPEYLHNVTGRIFTRVEKSR